jgi:hypothetical protein
MLKNKIIKAFLALIAICLTANSCGFKGYSQPYETTIQLVDMDGKPIKDVKVNIKMFINVGGFNNQGDFRISNTTNLEGNSVFNYSLNISEVTQDGASFAAADDTLWKVVNDVYHTVSNSGKEKTIKQVLKIQMDTLKTIKVRVQKTDATPRPLAIICQVNNGNAGVSTGSTYTTRLYENKFAFEWKKDSVGVLDTVLNCKIYAKAISYLRASSNQVTIDASGRTSTWIGRTTIIDFTRTTNRDAIFYVNF